MRGRCFAWLAVALTFLAPLSAGQAAPADAKGLRPTATPAEGNLATTFLFDAGIDVETGPELLANGGFPTNATGWQGASSEIGGGARFSWQAPGHLEVTVPRAQRSGSVHASQEAPLGGAPAYEFRVDLKGTDVAYAILLRESGYDPARHNVTRASWDTPVHGRVTGEWTTRSVTWTPRFEDSTKVRVYLRFSVAANDGATVSFDNVSLRAAERIGWDFNGDAAADALGATASWRFAEPGERVVRVRHERLDGAKENATVRVNVLNRAPEFGVQGPATVAPGDVARFEVTGLVDPDDVDLLSNGGFAEGMAPWLTRASEIGGNATFEIVQGERGPALRIDATAERGGSVYAYQTVPLPSQGPFLLTARYRDSGGGSSHEWLLRERSGEVTRDTKIPLPSSDAWTDLAYVWEPALGNATHVNVYLRLRLPANVSASASFAEVSLRRAPNVTWSWSDGTVSHGTRVERAFDVGAHEAVVRATDAAGATTERRVRVLAHEPVAVRLEGPQLALVDEPVAWRATPHRPTANLLDPTFASGWSFSSRETGTAGAWRVQGEGKEASAVMTVEGAAQRGTLYLHQTVPIDGSSTYRFQVEGAYDGAIERFQYILRERGYNATAEGAPRETHDTFVTVDPSSGGHAVDVAWTPRYASSDRVTVYLRAFVPTRATTQLVFHAPRLALDDAPAAAADVTWQAPGCAPCEGPGVLVRSDAPGVHEVHVAASTADGANASASARLLVVEELPSVARALDGSLLLRWQTPAAFAAEYAWEDAQGRRERLAPQSRSEGPLVAHEARVPAPEKPEARALVALTPEGESIRLASFGPALPNASVRLAAPFDPFVRPWAPAPLRVVVADPYVVQVEARLVDAEGAVVESFELRSLGEGAFAGEVPFAWGRLGRSYSVMLVASDASGANETLLVSEPLRTSLVDNVDPGRPGVWMVGLLALAAAGVGAWRRWGARRGA